MTLLLKKIYIFIFTNLQIVLTLVNILLLIIMVYLIYKTLIETKKPDIEKVKIIDVKELTEGKYFFLK